MGYNTDFYGRFQIKPPLSKSAIEKLDKLSVERHDLKSGMPGYYCNWVVGSDGSILEWNEGEKFYNYVEWLEYICKEIINPIGSFLIGTILYKGDEIDDMGIIYAGLDRKKNQRIEAVLDIIKSGPVPKWFIEE